MANDSENYAWEFFIAYASEDKQTAESLYDLLSPHSRVFLDSRSLLLGDDWDRELAQAQRAALITVVLISSKIDRAYYQREEIAAAIALSRANGGTHRVVPVYLDRRAFSSDSIPYGLRLKHGLTLSKRSGLSAVAQSLLELRERLREHKIGTTSNERSMRANESCEFATEESGKSSIGLSDLLENTRLLHRSMLQEEGGSIWLQLIVPAIDRAVLAGSVIAHFKDTRDHVDRLLGRSSSLSVEITKMIRELQEHKAFKAGIVEFHPLIGAVSHIFRGKPRFSCAVATCSEYLAKPEEMLADHITIA